MRTYVDRVKDEKKLIELLDQTPTLHKKIVIIECSDFVGKVNGHQVIVIGKKYEPLLPDLIFLLNYDEEWGIIEAIRLYFFTKYIKLGKYKLIPLDLGSIINDHAFNELNNLRSEIV